MLMARHAAEIAHNIAAVQERIAAAARRSGRSADEVELIAVTKTHSPRVVAMALRAGLTNCGENRVQEAEQKIEALAGEQVRWHLIGHLQTNKAKQAVALFDLIHSLDSVRLAEALSRHVDAASLLGQRRLPVLVQVNVSGEQTKEGFDLPGGVDNRATFDAFVAEVEQILVLPHLEVHGLMTIAPYVSDPEEVRPVFRSLRVLRDELAGRFPQATWRHLSMGMTNDFEVAIEEGATLVRVGRAIFGERETGRTTQG
jgi:pyridoxal phosphate enzyme (YggS family)